MVITTKNKNKKSMNNTVLKHRIIGFAGIAVVVLGLALQIIGSESAAAAQITTRSLTLQGVGTTGGSDPGGTVNHLFTFNLPTTGTLGSISFTYCTTASGTCTAPTGLDTSGVTLGTSTGVVFTSAVSTAANSAYITRVAASGGGAATEQLVGVINPTNTNGETFYVRIASYASTDTTGTAVDTGTVAAATARQIVLTGTMPESLIFCTGVTVGTTGGVPDCATATSGAVSFNQLFSPTDTATATSQMAASTNANSGYVITINGPTMTSGTNSIPAMGTATTGVRGTGQFGANLVANTTTTSTPAVGINIAPTSNGTNFKGNPQTGYNTADTFKFVSGDTVAQSDNGTPGSPGPTDAQIYTASYIVNVSGSQAAGTYTTTITYICTPTY